MNLKVDKGISLKKNSLKIWFFVINHNNLKLRTYGVRCFKKSFSFYFGEHLNFTEVTGFSIFIIIIVIFIIFEESSQFNLK